MPNIVLHLAYGPTAERANQLLFQGNVFYESEGIYLTTEGSVSAGAPLVSFDSTESILGLSWLPDGSGFVYSVTEGDFFGEDRSANLFVYSFATNEATRLTSFSGEFAGLLSVSPDGQRIVFERADEQVEFSLSLADPDLWVINRDGSGLQLLVENGRAPAWSR
jgi:Tol biopolymer transport system component